MARPRVRLAAALGALALVAGCSSGDGTVRRRDTSGDSGFVGGTGVVSVVPPADRAAAPAFRAPLLDGRGSFDLAAARGSVVVLNVWGSWCPPCRKEAPALEAAWRQLRKSGVRFVGVNTKDTPGQASAYVREFRLTYPSVEDEFGERLLAFRSSLPPAAIPSTLVIDRQGRVAGRVLGEVDRGTLVGMVQDVLTERA